MIQNVLAGSNEAVLSQESQIPRTFFGHAQNFLEIVFFALEIVFQEQNMSQLARKKIDLQYTAVIYIKRMFFIYRWFFLSQFQCIEMLVLGGWGYGCILERAGGIWEL